MHRIEHLWFEPSLRGPIGPPAPPYPPPHTKISKFVNRLSNMTQRGVSCDTRKDTKTHVTARPRGLIFSSERNHMTTNRSPIISAPLLLLSLVHSNSRLEPLTLKIIAWKCTYTYIYLCKILSDAPPRARGAERVGYQSENTCKHPQRSTKITRDNRHGRAEIRVPEKGLNKSVHFPSKTR